MPRPLGRGRVVDAVAGIPAWSSRHAVPVVAGVLVVTAVLGAGTTMITFEDNLVDLLPEGNPHTKAAKNVSQEFPENYYVTVINFHIGPEKWEEANRQLPNRMSRERPGNVTDEVYVRGLYEFNRYFLEHVEPAQYNWTLDSYVRLINYTNSAQCLEPEQGLCASDLDPEAFNHMMGRDLQGERRYAQSWRTFYEASPESAAAITSPDWDVARSVFLFEPDLGETPADVGEQVLQAWRDYKEWAPEHAEWDVFDLERSHVSARQPTTVNAHTQKVTEEDVESLSPLVALFIVGALYVAFRNGRSIGAAAATLAVAATWSLGAMGWAGIPLNTMNLAVVPLILGNGIDYSVHVVNAFLERKGRGLDDAEAFRQAGESAGVPLLVATATTVAGLLVMALSPSTLLAQVGLVSALAMASVFLLATAFLPATLTLLGTDGLEAAFSPSTRLPRLAESLADHRGAVLGLVAVLTVAGLAAGSSVQIDSFGTPALNFPEDDWAREQYRKENTHFYGIDEPEKEFATNWLVLEGDMTDPETHDYLRALEENVSAVEPVREDSVISIRFGIEQWQAIKGGTAAAPVAMARERARPGSTYPDSRAEIEETLDEVFASPLATYASLFIKPPDYRTSVLTFDVAHRPTFSASEDVWKAVWSAVEDVNRGHGKPDDIQVHMYGPTATSYLFVAGQLPWLQYMAVAGLAAVTGLVWFFTRDLRSTVAVSTLVTVTTVWWLGLLPAAGLGLSVAMMLPLVFIMSIGSDYAVHLAWNARRRGSAEAWATTGKAVWVSAVTDAGAFGIFALMRYQMMEDAMVATSLAIGTIFVATLLVIPLLQPGGGSPAEETTGGPVAG